MVNNLIENNICFVLSLETNQLLRECVNQKREKRIYLASSNVFCRHRTSLLRKECKSLEPGWMHHRLDLAFVGIHTCSSRTRTPNVTSRTKTPNVWRKQKTSISMTPKFEKENFPDLILKLEKKNLMGRDLRAESF